MATTIQSPRMGTTPRLVGQGFRYTNIVAGIWLFISAFFLNRPEQSQTNAWLTGVGIVVCAAWALRDAGLRYVNTALAVWLFVSATAVFRAPGPPMANDIIVSIIVFIVSLAPSAAGRGGNLLTPSSGAR